MNKFLWLIILILWILLGLWLCNKYLCGGIGAPAVAPATSKCAQPWNLKDGSFSLKSDEHISFPLSSAQHGESNNVNNAVTKVADYLKSSKDRSLTITGLYSNTEKKPAGSDNLGLARAQDVKSWLTKLGVPQNQILLGSRKADNDCYVDRYKKNGKLGQDGEVDYLKRGAVFSFGDLKVENVKKNLVGKNIVLYFATNSDELNLTPQQRKDFEDINYYLGQVKDARLDVSGHTDNVGDRTYNINLSKERAGFAKDYLVRTFSLPNQRMDVNGFGPDKPAADNSTADGRQKNRRVEVTLK